MPDRLLSLVVLVGAWVPPAAAGWAAAEFVRRRAPRIRPTVVYAALLAVAVVWTYAWFLFNVGRMPPYIPGATEDPTYASPQAVKGLLLFAGALVLPVSAIACMVAFRGRRRSLART